ncbi:MAG: hypothetical protein AAFU69_13060, partial [Pseudomonadota bacterium]
VSKRRRTLLAEAREILLKHRPAETPVLLASSLGRPELVWHFKPSLQVVVPACFFSDGSSQRSRAGSSACTP